MASKRSLNASRAFDHIKTAFRVCVATPAVKTFKASRSVHSLLSQMYDEWNPKRLNFTRRQRVAIVFLLEIMYWAVCIGAVYAIIALLSLNVSGVLSVVYAIIVMAIFLSFVAIVVWIYSTYGLKIGTIALVILIIIAAVLLN